MRKVLVVAVLLAMLAAACGGTSSADKTATALAKNANAASATKLPAATTMAKATSTAAAVHPTPTPVSMSFTTENWGLAVANPEKYKGSQVSLTGRVFTGPETDNNMICFQIWTDPDNSEGNTGVCSETEMGIRQDDYVRVRGTLAGEVEGTNAFGAKITIPVVLATGVDKITRSEAVAPALVVAEVNSAQTQHGLTITLNRVEIAATETRVWVTVTNASTSRASVYTYGTNLVQGNRQVESKYAYGTELPELPSDILPGIEAQGVLLFDPIDQAAKQARLVWDGPRTDDYSLDFADWIWDIRW